MFSISIKFMNKEPFEYNDVLFCKALLKIDKFEEIIFASNRILDHRRL